MNWRLHRARRVVQLRAVSPTVVVLLHLDKDVQNVQEEVDDVQVELNRPLDVVVWAKDLEHPEGVENNVAAEGQRAEDRIDQAHEPNAHGREEHAEQPVPEERVHAGEEDGSQEGEVPLGLERV